MAHSLTRGCISKLISSPKDDKTLGPFTVQVINLKEVAAASAAQPTRYRAVISDGQHYMQGMLTTQLNDLVTRSENPFAEFCTITVSDFIKNVVQDKTVAILLSVDVVAQGAAKFGEPEDVNKAGGAVAAPAAAGSMYNAPPKAPESGYSNNPYANKPAASYGGGGATMSAPGAGNIVPISALNPYQSRWTIQGRVTKKGDMKTWNNARGQGNLFSIDILDSQGMDVRGTFFKEDADKWFPQLEVEKVYTFSGGKLKVANAQWNTCKCQHEIAFDRSTEIKAVDDDNSIQQNIYDFKKIAELELIEPEANVDLLAVVASVGEVGTIIAKKTGNELTKCEITVVDDSNSEVRCTLWGEEAKKCTDLFAGCPVVAFKSLRVSDFGGRSLGFSFSSSMVVNPKMPEAAALKNWFESGGVTAERKKMSTGGGGKNDTFENRKTVASIKDETLGYNEKPDWLAFKASINFIKKDKEGGPWYPACPNPGEPCMQRYKVTQTSDSMWQCERCNKAYPDCFRRFIFSMTIMDDTSTVWATVFDDQAKELLGQSADDMNKLFEAGDMASFNTAFDEVINTDWVFKAMVKAETVGEEQRVKTTIKEMYKMDYVKETRSICAALKAL